MSEVAKLRIDPELRFESRGLRDYQERVSSILRAAPEAPKWTREAACLVLEGWTWKLRCGRRIWCERLEDPWSGWVSEEIAYERVTKGEK